MMLLAAETQVSDWCISICVLLGLNVISVVVLLVKFVGKFNLLFVCSVNKSFEGRK